MVKKMIELLPEKIGFKADLHCHTVQSDGFKTPEETKKFYKENGYSILAITDHAYMEDRSALSEEGFVVISGYENHLEPPWIKPNPRSTKCYHLNFYSPKPNKVGMIGITDYYYEFMVGFNKVVKRRSDELIGGCFIRENGGFSVACVNELVKQAEELGYLVVLNHPSWSHLDDGDVCGIKGVLGMEILNSDSYLGGYEEDNGCFYDRMLRDGQKLYCFANSDNHNDPRSKHDFFGYNVMYPDKLNYDGVFNCMKSGNFYASSGAALRGLYSDGNKISVGCEPAAYVRIITDRFSKNLRMTDKPILNAEFNIDEQSKYFRIVVKSVNGAKAYTHAYFKDKNGEWNK